MIVLYIWNNIFFILKKIMMCQDSNEMFNYKIKFIFNYVSLKVLIPINWLINPRIFM